ncbi:unnamed protein product [Parajaminaea phylloscopi]
MEAFAAGTTVKLASGALGVVKAVWSPENGMRKAGTLLLVKVGGKSLTVAPALVTPVAAATGPLGWAWWLASNILISVVTSTAAGAVWKLLQQNSDAIRATLHA